MPDSFSELRSAGGPNKPWVVGGVLALIVAMIGVALAAAYWYANPKPEPTNEVPETVTVTAQPQPRIDDTTSQRERVVAKLELGESQANFVWIPDAPAELPERLAEEGVLVRAFPEGVRVTVTNAAETDAFLKAWDRAQ